MASGALPKRVTCPACGSPEGLPCVDRSGGTFKPVKTHPERLRAAEVWYRTPSPDGLTPERRDAMVESLAGAGRGKTGQLMQRITTAADPEAEYAKVMREQGYS